MVSERERFTQLSTWVKNKQCRRCKAHLSAQNVAWLNQEYRIRCLCYPAEPQLERVKSLTEKYKTGSYLPIELKNKLDDRLKSI